MFNKKANKEYVNMQFEIKQEIKKLQSALDDHNAQAVNINWAHVGDMKHTLEQLKQINGKE